MKYRPRIETDELNKLARRASIKAREKVLDMPPLTNDFNLTEDKYVSDEAQTKPTLETIMASINALTVELRDFRSSVEDHLERIEIRLDRVESMALETRADVRELRKELRAHLNQFNQPA